MREDAEAYAKSTGKTAVRLTPAPAFREDSSMEFQPLSSEEKVIMDHIIQNACSNFGNDVNKLDNLQVNEVSWSIFMNDCMWGRILSE